MWRRIAALALGLAGSVIPTAAAQDVVVQGHKHETKVPDWMAEILAQDSTAFEFKRGLKSLLIRARAERELLASRGIDADTLGPMRAARFKASVTGRLHVPVLPILYSNSRGTPYPKADLQARLFGMGGGLTLSKLYSQMSRETFTIRGNVLDWTRVTKDDVYYEGRGFGSPPFLGELLTEVLNSLDATINFAQYDRDNDEYVDVVAFVQPESGGECGGNRNIWSHRWTYGAAMATGLAYKTNDGVLISDYVIQPAYECDGQRPVQVGVFAHEFGHAIGLPDLYSTSDPATNAGIGVWGLMGAGSWNRPESPAGMEAWSKAELGWIPVREVRADTDRVQLRPSQEDGEAVRISVPGSPGEYFLLENRQHRSSDIHLRGTGLLLWHVDSSTIATRRNANTVQNTTDRKGLDLVEADHGDLDNALGDADDADVFPGSTGTVDVTTAQFPEIRGYAASWPGFELRNIAEASGIVTFDLRFIRAQLASANEPPAAALAPPTITAGRTGPTALLKFSGLVKPQDLVWLQDRGFGIDTVYALTQSVLVKVPPEYSGSPQKDNPRITGFDVQQRDPNRP